MRTVILSFSASEHRDKALDLLRKDGVIIAPTDTVYGIMCRYDSSLAVQRLYQIKQRPPHKPIPVLIGDRDQLPQVARIPLPTAAEALANRFWPGPLTLIFPARDNLPVALTAGGTTVGVRMPDHLALCDLIRRAGPLAATSANRSGHSETHTAQQALEQLDGLIPLILSDDETGDRPPHSLASTIVDLSGPQPIIVRTGPIVDEVLDAVIRSGHPPC